MKENLLKSEKEWKKYLLLFMKVDTRNYEINAFSSTFVGFAFIMMNL